MQKVIFKTDFGHFSTAKRAVEVISWVQKLLQCTKVFDHNLDWFQCKWP